jgi:hypothetical protein
MGGAVAVVGGILCGQGEGVVPELGRVAAEERVIRAVGV